jgi:TetR/AcrR family transcriptional repressor of bet genes
VTVARRNRHASNRSDAATAVGESLTTAERIGSGADLLNCRSMTYLSIEQTVNRHRHPRSMPGTKIAESLRREQIITAAYQIAGRGGLRAVTIRSVAKKADMSTGLVVFHFRTKERVLLALLDHVLATTITLRVGADIEAIEDPLERLVALLRQEMVRLSSDPRHNRLFFEFWNEGLWNRAVRVRMQRELDRYRAAFRPMAGEVVTSDPDRFAGTTAESLAAVAVSFIKGCAVQSMVEPGLDVAGFLQAAEALLIPASSGLRPLGA